MTPLKDILEASHSAGETTATQGTERPKQDSGLRSDAVSLDVPVKVHGSRVTDVVRGITSHTEPFEEQTATMIVFPQGGVLKMSTAVTVGQMLVLTNLKTGHDAICRIVKVRACAPAQSYVEVEFTNRQPGYWGVQFVSDGPDVAQRLTRPVAPMAPSAAAPVANAAPPVAPSIAVPVAPTARVAQPSKPESPFVGIGAQEDVQLPASATVSKKADRVVANSPSLSMSELRGDAHSASPMSSLGSGIPGEVLELPSSDSESFELEELDRPATSGRLAAAASHGEGHSAAQPAFGSRFEPGMIGSSAQATAPHRKSGTNWVLVAAGVAAALVVGAGGAYYLHLWPSGKSSAGLTSAPPAPAVETTAEQNSVSNSAGQVNQSSPSVAANVPRVPVQAGEVASARASKTPDAVQADVTAPVSQKTSKAVPDMFGVLNAHPSSSRSTNSRDAGAAPSLDPGAASSSENGALQALGTSSPLAPPPAASSNSPAHGPSGGDVRAARLIHSVMPVYPSVAKASRIEGNVIVSTSIDKSGNVTGMKVVSGPVLLRQAALDALAHWKYQPATLNGEPVEVQFTVTVQFHQ